jgi:hypothetical protein
MRAPLKTAVSWVRVRASPVRSLASQPVFSGAAIFCNHAGRRARAV